MSGPTSPGPFGRLTRSGSRTASPSVRMWGTFDHERADRRIRAGARQPRLRNGGSGISIDNSYMLRAKTSSSRGTASGDAAATPREGYGVDVKGDVRSARIGGSGPVRATSSAERDRHPRVGVRRPRSRRTVIRGNRSVRRRTGWRHEGMTYSGSIFKVRATQPSAGRARRSECHQRQQPDRCGRRVQRSIIESVAIQGNFIGTNASGTAALPNGSAGLSCRAAA